MSTSNNERAKAQQEPRVVERLVIQLIDGGGVVVDGPVGNKLLCFGLLKAAEIAIATRRQDVPRVVVPRLQIPGT